MQLVDRSSKKHLYIVICMGLFLFVAPFYKGLFNGEGYWNGFFSNSFGFENPIYGALQWTSVLLIVLGIVLLYDWNTNQKNDLLMIGIWFVPLSYLLAIPSQASSHMNAISIQIQVLFATFFIAGMWISRQVAAARMLTYCMVISAYVVVLYGLFNLLGDATFGGIFSYNNSSRIFPDSVSIEPRGMRLTSIFQYANTYAAFLLAFFFATLMILVMSKSRVAIWVSSIMLVPMFLSLLLTQSRGGILVFPILFIVILFFLTTRQQLHMMVYMLLTMLLSVIIYSPISNMALTLHEDFTRSLFFTGCTLLFGTSLLTALLLNCYMRFLVPFIEKIANRVKSRRIARIYIPASFVLIGVALFYSIFVDNHFVQVLPVTIQKEIASLTLQTHSVLERATFYQNAFAIIRDYPFFGAGGGAWSALYESYQTNPYTSRQAHNYYLQYWIETGTVGVLILLALFVIVIYQFIRGYMCRSDSDRLPYLLFFTVAISFLIHSAIDFNMSYVYVGALVFLSLGGMASTNTELPPYPFQKKWVTPLVRKVYSGALMIVALIIFIMASRHAQINHLYQQSIQNLTDQKPLNEILVPIDQALDAYAHPDYYNYKISLLTQALAQGIASHQHANEAIETVETTITKYPYMKQSYFQAYTLYVQQGLLEQALTITKAGLERFPWEMSLVERGIILHYEITRRDPASADSHMDKILILYEDVLSKQTHLQTLPDAQDQGNAFDISKDMALIVGEIYFNRGEYEKAEGVINDLLNIELAEPVDRALAKYYLAAQLMQGHPNQSLYERVEANYPNVIEEIKSIVE